MSQGFVASCGMGPKAATADRLLSLACNAEYIGNTDDDLAVMFLNLGMIPKKNITSIERKIAAMKSQ
jgi:hypothetical protein